MEEVNDSEEEEEEEKWLLVNEVVHPASLHFGEKKYSRNLSRWLKYERGKSETHPQINLDLSIQLQMTAPSRVPVAMCFQPKTAEPLVKLISFNPDDVKESHSLN